MVYDVRLRAVRHIEKEVRGVCVARISLEGVHDQFVGSG